MITPHRRLSVSELLTFVKDYHQAAFPAWRLVGKDRLVREAGPVVQQIGFERLRTGEYRPTGAVRVLVAPHSAGLHRDLNIKVRSILPRQHERKLPDVVRAIRAEFVPSVEKPLDANEVLAIYLSENPLKAHDAYAIAALAAYLKQDKVALDWCQKFDDLIQGQAMPEWQCRQKDLVDRVRGWISEGRAVAALEKILQEELKRLSLA